MGNSHSSEVTLEEFKDQVFGTTVFLLAKAANPHLEFKTRDECSADSLPLPKLDSDNIYEVALSYYNYLDHKGTELDLDDKIEEYVYKNILNSKENVTRFYKLLIDRLMAKSVVTSIPQPSIPQPTIQQQQQQQQQQVRSVQQQKSTNSLKRQHSTSPNTYQQLAGMRNGAGVTKIPPKPSTSRTLSTTHSLKSQRRPVQETRQPLKKQVKQEQEPSLASVVSVPPAKFDTCVLTDLGSEPRVCKRRVETRGKLVEPTNSNSNSSRRGNKRQESESKEDNKQTSWVEIDDNQPPEYAVPERQQDVDVDEHQEVLQNEVEDDVEDEQDDLEDEGIQDNADEQDDVDEDDQDDVEEDDVEQDNVEQDEQEQDNAEEGADQDDAEEADQDDAQVEQESEEVNVILEDQPGSIEKVAVDEEEFDGDDLEYDEYETLPEY